MKRTCSASYSAPKIGKFGLASPCRDKPDEGSHSLGVPPSFARGRAIRCKSSLSSGLSAAIPHAKDIGEAKKDRNVLPQQRYAANIFMLVMEYVSNVNDIDIGIFLARDS